MFLAMRLRLRVFCALLLAGAVVALSVPAVRALAMRVGAVDRPDKSRRVNTVPVPRLGGLAIFLGFLGGVLAFADLPGSVEGILLGSVLIVLLGTADDILDLKPWIKLLVQTLAAGIAVASGVEIRILTNPGVLDGVIPLGSLSVPLTLLWIVGITNALNLLDGLDGLAAGVAGIGCASMLVVSLFLPEVSDVSVLLGALGGACLGFLPYNRNPASIFMGDSGSLLLGYVLSTVSVLGLLKMYTVVTFTVPLLVLALPLSDTVFAVVRRLLRKESPLQADMGHIHHRLLAMGLSQKQAVWLLYGVSVLMGLGAVLLAAHASVRFWLLLGAMAAVLALCSAAMFRRKKRPAPTKTDTPPWRSDNPPRR
ncbi:MAG: undecaprenyl/decaprenyl-phosphate alpha-N-acetylglucosaminyl 1-phosphate transferase [Oscillospiraceae bacterium]|nr:undecaprenyl/decaprenyl-phosphate alpha-N-acetylglucosaminyl 1-phosphate transferase [Oscillospiraceae bacterium]